MIESDQVTTRSETAPATVAGAIAVAAIVALVVIRLTLEKK